MSSRSSPAGARRMVATPIRSRAPSFMLVPVDTVSHHPMQPEDSNMDVSHDAPPVTIEIPAGSANSGYVTTRIDDNTYLLMPPVADEPSAELTENQEGNLPEPVTLRAGEEENVAPVERRRPEAKPLDDTSEIDKVINVELSKISVKTLRAVVPRLRVNAFLKEEEICGKKKVKNLWAERPEGYPTDVPFKDPNNKGPDGKKASKQELEEMFKFLRARYLEQRISPEVEAAAGSSEEGAAAVAEIVTLKEEDKSATPKRKTPSAAFSELMERIREKVEQLVSIVSGNTEMNKKIEEVYNRVLLQLYNHSTVMECGCELLDVGHQFETLLDVALVYGGQMVPVFVRGCDEILDKYFPNGCDGTTQEQTMDPRINQVSTALVDIKPSLTLANGDHFLPVDRYGVRVRDPSVGMEQFIDPRSPTEGSTASNPPKMEDVKIMMDMDTQEEVMEDDHSEADRALPNYSPYTADEHALGDLVAYLLSGEAVESSGNTATEPHTFVLDSIPASQPSAVQTQGNPNAPLTLPLQMMDDQKTQESNIPLTVQFLESDEDVDMSCFYQPP